MWVFGKRLKHFYELINGLHSHFYEHKITYAAHFYEHNIQLVRTGQREIVDRVVT